MTTGEGMLLHDARRALTSIMLPIPREDQDMSDAKLGLQLIVYGGRQNEDLPGVLAEVAEVGYAGAETGAMYPDMGAQAVIKAFADADLALTGVHSGYADCADDKQANPNPIPFLHRILELPHAIESPVLPGHFLASDPDGDEIE